MRTIHRMDMALVSTLQLIYLLKSRPGSYLHSILKSHSATM